MRGLVWSESIAELMFGELDITFGYLQQFHAPSCSFDKVVSLMLVHTFAHQPPSLSTSSPTTKGSTDLIK